ncbi:SMI1/KNR4 family protein [Marinomonas sp. S3726]|uniref:SMI1/KNR4 family protein n=1 Tax=Marinomonas sp. S3726 TaxID=579484 RepID=UPI0006968C47|nr:SMI1/KNR4 family protein [Marinomonas sp. S3726]
MPILILVSTAIILLFLLTYWEYKDSIVYQFGYYLKHNKPEVYFHLNRGVRRKQLNNLEKTYNVEFPKEFRRLYSWRNGQRDNCYENFIDNFMFMSIGEVISTKEMLDSMIGYDFDDPNWWKVEWVPFLHNGGGDYCVLDLKTGEIVSFYHEFDDRSVIASNLEELLEFVIDEKEIVF